MNRRQFLAAIAAGAIVTAEGLWIPGKKLISIAKPSKFGTPLDAWLTFNDNRLKHFIIYATKEYRGDKIVYDAPDTTLKADRDLHVDGVYVKSPLPMGPPGVKIPFENCNWRASAGSSLTLQWAHEGIMTVS